jgi:hypothetical protein
MGEMKLKRPTAIQGAMNHANTSFSTEEIFADAMVSVVQYFAPLRYLMCQEPFLLHLDKAFILMRPLQKGRNCCAGCR